MTRLVTPLLLILLAGCAFVRLTPEGMDVAVATEQEVSGCDRLAQTTVRVADRVVFRRSEPRVRQELEILARNTAAERGGDTVVAVSPVNDGQRDYGIYQCD